VTRRRQELGKEGEAIAARFLEQRGYRILARRFRTRLGEIDLVALAGETLVFVEVKLRTGPGFGSPAEAVHPLKQARLARVAALFLQSHAPDAVREPVCRFDVVAIRLAAGRSPDVEHIQDAFRPAG